jgi:hypothetical protein
MSTKLTKKQKKAAAFRRRGGKGLEDVLDVPIMDDPEADDGFGEETTAAIVPLEEFKPVQTKKRKRDDESALEDALSRKKVKPSKEELDEVQEPKAKKPKAAPKYILFVGKELLSHISHRY